MHGDNDLMLQYPKMHLWQKWAQKLELIHRKRPLNSSGLDKSFDRELIEEPKNWKMRKNTRFF